jgi:bifunctional UDP-N-acetylglucosamine pyrophosphorylase / glucosamine-1-phosphate N-acetyltransferase
MKHNMRKPSVKAVRRKSAPTALLRNTAIVVLAAGKGTRLKSRHPKVLHAIGGKPLLLHVIAAAAQVVPCDHIYAVIGHEAERVRQAAGHTGVHFVLQSQQRGTGHALMCAREQWHNYESVVVLSGDVPLIQPATIRRLAEFRAQNSAAMAILTALPDDPTGYGRIVRQRGPRVSAIVEQNALRGKQADIREINSGIYAFRTPPLLEHLSKLGTDNPHHEYYLTDIVGLLVASGERVVALSAERTDEVLGVNTRAELARLDAILRRKKTDALMASGVTFLRPETCLIDADVEIGADTTVDPFVQIFGKTTIGSECHIGSFTAIQDSRVGDFVEIRQGCIMNQTTVHHRAVLGPYAHARPESEIGEGAHVGNFVETKKTRLGKNSKANHLTYLGDAEIGQGVNIGAGTITCNYDGVHKHKTVIADGAFIGSDTTLVAPVRVGAGAYIGAGSCITSEVPEDSLALARSLQVVKPGWARKRREQRADLPKR